MKISEKFKSAMPSNLVLSVRYEEMIEAIQQLERQLESCAAGPWCYDIGKAPGEPAQHPILVITRTGTVGMGDLSIRYEQGLGQKVVLIEKNTGVEPIAWAEIRMPEATHEAD